MKDFFTNKLIISFSIITLGAIFIGSQNWENKPITDTKEQTGINYQVTMKSITNELEIAKYEELEQICELDRTSCLIKEIAEEYEIDYKLAIAISRHETGNYKSRAFKELNNVGGNMKNGKLRKFESLKDGIEFFIRNLKRNYIDKELTTIEEIQPVYAPINAKNDPQKLNNYWIKGVSKIYESLEV